MQFYGEDLFFGRHLFLDQKIVTPRNPPRVPLSLATPLLTVILTSYFCTFFFNSAQRRGRVDHVAKWQY